MFKLFANFRVQKMCRYKKEKLFESGTKRTSTDLDAV
jgi:hypothetical protein